MKNADTTQANNISKNKELLEKFIVLEIKNENFIIPLLYVNEIVRVQEVTQSPHQPNWIRGIMNLRDSVISLVDTRKRLGINSYGEEVHAMLIRNRESHINRINLIEKVSQKFNFDEFQTAQKNVCTFDKSINELISKQDFSHSIKSKMRDIQSVHEKMHEILNWTLTLINKGNKEAATQANIIKYELLPNFLEKLEDLIKSINGASTNEIAVIIEYNASHFAMLADEIKKMKTFDLDRRQKGSLTDNPFIMGVFDNEEGLYQELDLKGILEGYSSNSEKEEQHSAKHTVNLKELSKQTIS